MKKTFLVYLCQQAKEEQILIVQVGRARRLLPSRALYHIVSGTLRLITRVCLVFPAGANVLVAHAV